MSFSIQRDYLAEGACESTLNNCTICGNSAGQIGGGVYGGNLGNCIIYYNTAPVEPNWSGGTLNHCCTTPFPTNGVGNISAAPLLADPFHLSADSPCRGSGNQVIVKGIDIDDEAWSNPPSIGCDEYYFSAQTGLISVGLEANSSNVAASYPVKLSPQISGHATSNLWDFGDGQFLTNHPYATTHTWPLPGDYTVVLRVFNRTFPNGVSAVLQVHVVEEVHYASISSSNPVPPYTSLETAATNIQAAVDAAVLPGAQVLVGPGIYQSGGRVVYGTITNRVVVTNSTILQSLSGPGVTVIQGFQVPGTTTGDAAVRCVYLGSNAVLSGFTIRSGATRRTGNVSQEQSGGGVWCTSTNSIVMNCVIEGCSANANGGGVYRGRLNNCTLRENAADIGGGANGSLLIGCAISENKAVTYGGGADGSFLINCTVIGNSATLGGGIESCGARNCIVFYNSAFWKGANYVSGSLDHCCADPLPATGFGNIASQPMLADFVHLSPLSPCMGAGGLTAIGSDIDGDQWANPPSIGCDEYVAGGITGPLAVAIHTAFTNVAVGTTVKFSAKTIGHASSNRWSFGDGAILNNLPYVSHSWSSPGTFPVVLEVFNESNPGGISASSMVQVISQPVHYVRAENSLAAAPFDTWTTAATNIQDAIDSAVTAGALVLVSNGVYRTGGRVVFGSMTNRVVITRPLVLQSVNGPEFTTIEGQFAAGTTNGDSAVRCVYLADGAQLRGFTLTKGATRSTGVDSFEMRGGGVWCEAQGAIVSNCIISSNSAPTGGAGAYQGTLNSCIVSTNFGHYGAGVYNCSVSNSVVDGNVGGYGGGACASVLNKCSLSGNSAGSGGGVGDCVLTNSTILGNKSGWGGGAINSTLQSCSVRSNSVIGGFGGGGCYNCTLSSCLIVGNFSDSVGGTDSCLVNNCSVVANAGGGIAGSTVNNSIVYFNSPANHYSSRFTYSCAPAIPSGAGNFTNVPLFVDLMAGDLRLAPNSPCINSGNNVFALNDLDLSGNIRVRGGTVDLGAYEFPSPSSVLSYVWLQQYQLPTDGSVDFVDTDADGMNNWQEWITGTDPTNATSLLKLLSIGRTNSTNILVTWQSVANHNYFLQRSTNLIPYSLFSTIVSNIPGQQGATTFVDTNTEAIRSAYYRVGVW